MLFCRNTLAVILSLFVPLASPAQPAGEDVSQTAALDQAAKVNESGSDDSLRLSATQAMRAIIKFGDGDIKGAISGAYSAYGKFKNSENLDRAHKQGILAKASLAADGTSNLSDKDTAFLASVTSYRRIDPAFLGKGEDAKLAEEFEKKTGIQRKDFLDMLASAAENKLYVSDPKLAEKVDAQFEGFVNKIPNPEFKAKVQNALSLVPSLTKHKLLVEAVQKMVQVAKNFTGGDATSSTVTSAAREKADGAAAGERAPASGESTIAAADEKDKEKDAKDAEATQFLESTLNADPIARAGEDGGSHKLDGVIKAAIHDDPESETIFEKVSRRYRMLTPDLVPPKEAKPARD